MLAELTVPVAAKAIEFRTHSKLMSSAFWPRPAGSSDQKWMRCPRTGLPNWSVKVAVTAVTAPWPSSDASAYFCLVSNVSWAGTPASSDQV